MSCAYADPRYLLSLAPPAEVVSLPRSGGALIVRPIPGTGLCDATGPYPLLMCENWSELAEDLTALQVPLVSAVCVLDPLVASPATQDLQAAFPDILRPYKCHHVVELGRQWESGVSHHHLRNARKALGRTEIHVSESPATYLDEWTCLYEELVQRHQIEGPARFSRQAFEHQMGVPGAVLFRALAQGQLVGATLWYRCHDRAYYHLGAYTGAGYRAAASHAIFLTALRWFHQSGVKQLNLGAGAGIADDPSDGLNRFKQGWANTFRMALLGGRILNQEAYRKLAGGRPATGNEPYFPVYRDPRPNGLPTASGA